jgi:hypothetical protein
MLVRSCYCEEQFKQVTGVRRWKLTFVVEARFNAQILYVTIRETLPLIDDNLGDYTVTIAPDCQSADVAIIWVNAILNGMTVTIAMDVLLLGRYGDCTNQQAVGDFYWGDSQE